MVKCPFCHKLHVANTVFCDDCGNYLLEDEQRETDPLDDEETGWVGETTVEPDLARRYQQDGQRLAIRFRIGAAKRQVEAPLEKVLHVGRVDPSANIFPEIDLTDDDVVNKCVSRRHARILRQDNRVVVEDLGSVNGTFINGNRLAPYLPEILNDGDILQLGKLLIEIKIVRRR